MSAAAYQDSAPCVRRLALELGVAPGFLVRAAQRAGMTQHELVAVLGALPRECAEVVARHVRRHAAIVRAHDAGFARSLESAANMLERGAE